MATIKSLEAEVVGLHYLDKLKPLGCGVERITERQFLQSDLLTPMGLRLGMEKRTFCEGLFISSTSQEFKVILSHIYAKDFSL